MQRVVLIITIILSFIAISGPIELHAQTDTATIANEDTVTLDGRLHPDVILTSLTVSHSLYDFNLAYDDVRKQVIIIALDSNGVPNTTAFGTSNVTFNGESPESLVFRDGVDTISATLLDGLVFVENKEQSLSYKLYHISATTDGYRVKHIPLWMSILPPLLAIFLALVFKEVLISLFSGVWLGAFIANGMSFKLLLMSLLNTIDKYALNALTDGGHASIIIFSLMIGGMVAVISRNGGMQGVVNSLSGFAKNKQRSQLVTWFLGIAIFFDDYANTLIVGNTMRPVTDKFKISREKLAYIVDSTAAPVASIAFITTWIGAELDYIGSALEGLGIEESAYSMFIGSLEYAHYSIFTLIFIFILIVMQRDFGPMLTAEHKAAAASDAEAITDDEEIKALDMKPGIKPQAINGVLPIVTVVITVMVGLLYTGGGDIWSSDISFGAKLSATMGSLNALSSTIGNADSYVALLWASLTGLGMAISITLGRRLLSLTETMDITVKGFKSLLIAMLILIVAWSLGAITEELHTANFLTGLMIGNVSPYLVPMVTFLLAAGVSFSTGSSWSTMAILFPIMLPTTWMLCTAAGIDHESAMQIMYYVIAVIMGGSVFGDHCSPISDTTILSSLASSCNHIDHVRTQLPYAITVGLVSLLFGGVFFYFGVPWYIIYPLGILAMVAIVRFVGKSSAVD